MKKEITDSNVSGFWQKETAQGKGSLIVDRSEICFPFVARDAGNNQIELRAKRTQNQYGCRQRDDFASQAKLDMVLEKRLVLCLCALLGLIFGVGWRPRRD